MDVLDEKVNGGPPPVEVEEIVSVRDGECICVRWRSFRY